MFEELSKKEQGYLVGLFIGDGYSHHDKNNRHYNVDFYLNSVRDKDIIRYLIKLLTASNFNASLFKDKRFNALRVRVSSKQLMGTLDSNMKNFLKDAVSDKGFLMGAVSGFIDAEGYVDNGEIVVTQKDKDVLESIKYACEILDIPLRKFWSFKDYRAGGEIWRLRISTQIRKHNHNSCKLNRLRKV